MSEPMKPTEDELRDARRHDGWIGDAFVDLKCGHPACTVRRRAEWENKIMREALEKLTEGGDQEWVDVASDTLEKIDR